MEGNSNPRALPSQGFRHAAVLLVSQSVSRISADDPTSAVATVFVQLSHDLVALARDMRCGGEVVDWLTSEIDRTVDRLPHEIDARGIKAAAHDVLRGLPSRLPPIETRDLFLVYVPEDRLPVAAPLAVELSKRRVTVAVAGYEVASADDVHQAVDAGLHHHRRGALLRTAGFNRKGWTLNVQEDERFRVLSEGTTETLVDEVLRWFRSGPG